MVSCPTQDRIIFNYFPFSLEVENFSQQVPPFMEFVRTFLHCEFMGTYVDLVVHGAGILYMHVREAEYMYFALLYEMLKIMAVLN